MTQTRKQRRRWRTNTISLRRSHWRLFLPIPPLMPCSSPRQRRRWQNCQKPLFKSALVQIGFNCRFDSGYAAVVARTKGSEIGKPEKVILTSREPALPSVDYLITTGLQAGKRHRHGDGCHANRRWCVVSHQLLEAGCIWLRPTPRSVWWKRLLWSKQLHPNGGGIIK